jgi:hypothetical protein
MPAGSTKNQFASVGDETHTDRTRFEPVAEKIFRLLRHRGPLSATQISIELLEQLETIREALALLRAEQVVEERPDRRGAQGVDADLIAWGLAKR